jgi:hypothetical protein
MGSVALSSAIAVAVLMVGMWALSARLANVSIVDLVWGLAFVVVAYTSRAVVDPQPPHRPADRPGHHLGIPPVGLPVLAQLGDRRRQALRGHAQTLR